MLSRQFILVVLLLVSIPAVAQTAQYISDQIPVMLRSGPSLRNRILETLTAGDKVVVLESNADSGYSHVRVVGDGTEGWLLTRFLMAQPAARDQLAAAKKKLGEVQAETSTLKSRVASLTNEVTQTHAKLASVQSRNDSVTSQLQQVRSASANAIQLSKENDRLQQRVADSRRRINRLTMQKTELKSQNRQQWFLVGAAVLVGGVIIGLIAPHTKRKKRSRW